MLKKPEDQHDSLFLLTLCPRIPLMRILIIRPAALGDTLMLVPALFKSREWGEVIVAGRKPGIQFLKPLVSDCLDFESQGWHSLFPDAPGPDVSLPLRDADRIIAFLNDAHGTVRRNLGRFFPGASVDVLPGYPREDEPLHVALYLAKALEHHGLPVDAEKIMSMAVKRPLLVSGHRPRFQVVFHPGSGGAKKNYPPEFWVDLIKAWRKRCASDRERLVTLLGPAEEELSPVFSKIEGVELARSPELDELSLLLQEALLCVGHDSGITHLAAMLGAPTIALFRHTSVVQWSPLGPKVKAIQAKESGPQLVDEVLRAAREFLALL
jgi:hypothetical protein